MYRAELLRCGYCSTPMEVVPVPVPHGEPPLSDVCPACSGVFLEYFDGEPIGIAAALLRVRPELEADDDDDTADDELSAGAYDLAAAPTPGHCPGCGGTAVEPLRYLDGPIVARCHDCLSLSATRAQLVLLARHRVRAERSLPWWQRLRSRLARWLSR